MDETRLAALRRHDPDRSFTVLFAPAARRDALLTLYAFNHEIARAPEATSEPGLALIRLQWWREVVEGAERAHEVATPLHAALAQGQLHAPDLLAMIEAREQEAEGEMPTLAAWQDWLLAGAGSVAVAAGRALGAPPPALDRLRRLGAGYGAAGQLRNTAAFARQGRCLLPRDRLAAAGMAAEAVIAAPDQPGLHPLRRELADYGLSLLGAPEPCRADWVAAGLPAVYARYDLARYAQPDLARPDLASPVVPAGPRPLSIRLAIVAAALRHRA